MSHVFPAPKDFTRIGKTLYQGPTGAGGQKRASLVFIGASVCWGDGLDMTDTYAYKIQQQIDTYLAANGWGAGKTLGGWVPRFVHTDDFQEGDLAANADPITTGKTRPYNGSANNPGWGAGNDSPSAYLLNPLISPYGAGNYGRSKLNYDPYTSAGLPVQADAGVFGGTTFGGIKYNTAPYYSGWTDGGIRLAASGQNIRWAVNFTANTSYLFMVLSNRGGTTAQATVYGATGTPPSVWTMPDPLGTGRAGGISIPANTTIRVLFAIPKTTGYVAGSPQQMSMAWYSGGAVDVDVLAPLNDAQALSVGTGTGFPISHVLVQVAARNSYCLQDYYNTGWSGRSAGYVLDTIMNGVVNSPYYDGSSNASAPFYVIGDTYNSMISNLPIPPGFSTYNDRRLSPSAYGQLLDTMGKYLSDPAKNNHGLPILTMPIRVQCSSTLFLQNSNGWIGGTNHNSAGLSGSRSYPQWSDYWQVLYNLAATRGWGFVDQSQFTMGGTSQINGSYLSNTNPAVSSCWISGDDSYPYQRDQLHPTKTFTTYIANGWVSALGLSGGV